MSSARELSPPYPHSPLSSQQSMVFHPRYVTEFAPAPMTAKWIVLGEMSHWTTLLHLTLLITSSRNSMLRASRRAASPRTCQTSLAVPSLFMGQPWLMATCCSSPGFQTSPSPLYGLSLNIDSQSPSFSGDLGTSKSTKPTPNASPSFPLSLMAMVLA